MIPSTLRSVLFGLLPAIAVCTFQVQDSTIHQDQPAHETRETLKRPAIQIHYLEIVTPELDATCDALEELHSVSFSEPEAGLGNARTAQLAGGGLIGVRAPLRADEAPVVRPYVRVDDIEAAVEAARAAGAEIAIPPMPIPERGRFAIYILGGIEHGLWQE